MALNAVDKQKLITRAGAELLELDRRFAVAMKNLQRISEGKKALTALPS